jgi:ATP-dependent Clp protease ATP-binding subunit ClpA
LSVTDRARRMMDLADEEARLLNHAYVGTEHLLLGLIGEGGGVAAQALESLGISLEAVRQQVEQVIGRGQQAVPGHIPLTPRAKKVLELARREAFPAGSQLHRPTLGAHDVHRGGRRQAAWVVGGVDALRRWAADTLRRALAEGLRC